MSVTLELPKPENFPPLSKQIRKPYAIAECDFMLKNSWFSQGPIDGFAYYYDLDDDEIDHVTMIVRKGDRMIEYYLNDRGDEGAIVEQVKRHLEPQRYDAMRKRKK